MVIDVVRVQFERMYGHDKKQSRYQLDKLPILLVVIEKDNDFSPVPVLVSRDRFDHPVPRQPTHSPH